MDWRGNWDAPSLGEELQRRLEQNKRAHQESDGVSFEPSRQRFIPQFSASAARVSQRIILFPPFSARRYEPRWKRRRSRRPECRSGNNRFCHSRHSSRRCSNSSRSSNRRRWTRVSWENQRRSHWTCWTHPRRRWTSRDFPRNVKWNWNSRALPRKSPRN